MGLARLGWVSDSGPCTAAITAVYGGGCYDAYGNYVPCGYGYGHGYGYGGYGY